MKGGTYAEALRAGFTEQQAAFFARLGGETRDEAVDAMNKNLDARKRGETSRRAAKRRDMIMTVTVVLVGMITGVLLTKVI